MSQEPVPHWAGAGRPGPAPGAATGLVLVAMLVLAGSLPASAQVAPRYRVGGLNDSGPTRPLVTAAWFNPGALGLLRGTHAFASGLVALGSYQAARDPIDPRTGQSSPSGRLTFAPARSSEPQLDYFVGVASDLGSESFVFALAAYLPVHRNLRWPGMPSAAGAGLPGDEGPGRYAAVELFQRVHYVSTVATYRVSPRLAIGAGLTVGIAETTYAYVTDLALLRPDLAQSPGGCGRSACGFEHPFAAQRFRLDTLGVGLAPVAGILWRPHRRWTLGLAYHARLLGVNGGTRLEGSGRAEVVLPSSPAISRVGLAPSAALFGQGQLATVIPDVVHLGVAWRTNRRLELGLDLRYAATRLMDVVGVTLGSNLARVDRTVVPPHQVRYLGYRDSVVTELRARVAVLPRLWLLASVAYDTGAVPTPAQSALSFDGPRLFALAGASYTWRRLTMGAGYQLEWLRTRATGESVFDPQAAVRCANAAGDLAACAEADAGRGLPTQAGRYGALLHQLGANISVRLGSYQR